MTTRVLGIPLSRSKAFDDFMGRALFEVNRLVVYSIDNLPQFVEAIFGPLHIWQSIKLVGSLQLFIMGWSAMHRLTTWSWHRVTSTGQKILALKSKMQDAETYVEWLEYANELDVVRGVDKWRNNDISPLFDNRKLRKRIVDTQDMLKRGNIFDIMFRMRGGLTRDEYGILDRDLYTVSAVGTKKIIEEYTETTRKALVEICDSETPDIPDEAKLAFFNEARHAYGRTALLLSGGAYLGYYHLGVFKSLFQNKMLPRIISGASAGSLMAVVIGSKTDEELEEIFEAPIEMNPIRRDFFKFSTKIAHPLGQSIQRACPSFLLPIMNPILSLVFDWKIQNLDIKHLQECCIGNVGRFTFQEAFDRTGRIINITVTPHNNYDPPRLLNYLTSPHVCVWSAACASCAIPGIFDAAELIVKEPTGEYVPESVSDERRSAAAAAAKGHAYHKTAARQKILYSDGSIENDLPMQQLSELFNVNHFIISQVNPHSAFLSTLTLRGQFNEKSFLLRTLIAYTHFMKEQVIAWVKNITLFLVSFRQNAPRWSMMRGFYSTITQSYEGRENDITITPWANHISLFQAFTSVLKNPTEAEFSDVTHASEVAVWSSFSKIIAQCKVEFCLDRCVQKLRKQIAMRNSTRSFESGSGSLSQPSTTITPPPDVQEVSTGKKKLDRTPSFFTTRSVLNLSGLSVSDPMPILEADAAEDQDEFAGIDIDAEMHATHTPSPQKSLKLDADSDKSKAKAKEKVGEDKFVPITKSTRYVSNFILPAYLLPFLHLIHFYSIFFFNSMANFYYKNSLANNKEK